MSIFRMSCSISELNQAGASAFEIGDISDSLFADLNQNFIPTPQTNHVLGAQSQIQSFNTIMNGTPKIMRNPNIFRTKELEEGELPSSDTENFYFENKIAPFKEEGHW